MRERPTQKILTGLLGHLGGTPWHTHLGDFPSPPLLDPDASAGIHLVRFCSKHIMSVNSEDSIHMYKNTICFGELEKG